ncbi:MAG TPA: heparinase II/III family protein [Tepidisphaeraceae bacterium]
MGTWGSSGCSLSDPGHIACPKGHRLPDDEHPDPGTGWRDHTGKLFYFVGAYNSFVSEQLLEALNDLTDAFALTGDRRYAEKAALLLDHLARIYPSCNKGSWDYPSDPPSGRFNRPWYQVARTLISYANHYDILMSCDALDAPSSVPGLTRRGNIEQNLLLNGARYCYDRSLEHPALHNGQCDYMRGCMVVGAAMGVPALIEHGVHSPTGIYSMLENNIDRDGQYYETSSLYSHHTRYLYMDVAEILHNYSDAQRLGGIHLFDHPRFRAFFTLPQSRITVNGMLATLGDDAPNVSTTKPASPVAVADVAYLEHLLALAKDATDQQRLADLLRGATRGNVDAARAGAPKSERTWLLFHGRDLPALLPAAGDEDDAPIHPLSNSPLTSSDLLTQKGIAILRSSTTPTAITLRFGPTLNHGHFDEMGINLYALGRQLSYDLGYGLGSTHTQVGWAKQTASHNTVLVNETPQLRAAGAGGSLELFADLPGVKLVQADDPGAYTSEKVSRYARMVALIDASPDSSYVFDVLRIIGGDKHDYIDHAPTTQLAVEGVALAPPRKGSLAGEDIDHGAKQGPDGDVIGVSNKPYWNPPPGNGFGFLMNPRVSQREHSGSGAGTISATWNIDGKAHLALTLLPMTQTQLMTASAPGIYPKFPRAGYVYARRAGSNLSSTFAAIQEPFGSKSVVKEIISLTDPLESAADPVAVKVTLTTGRTDYLFHAPTDSAQRVSDGARTFTSAARFSRVSLDNSGISHASFVAGTSLSFDDVVLSVPAAAYTGTFFEIDLEKNILVTRTPLPEGDVLAGQFIMISNPGYSRSTTYRIARVARTQRAMVDCWAVYLAPTTMVLARAHMDRVPPSGDRQTLANIIPLEYAKSLAHKSTGFFKGKRIIRADKPSEGSGHVIDIKGDDGTTITVQSRVPFTTAGGLLIYDVQDSDTFAIPTFATISRSDDSTFNYQCNAPLTIQTARGTATLPPARNPKPTQLP